MRGVNMGRYMSKSHNKTLLLYHVVLSVKYRRSVFTEDVIDTLVNTCMDLEDRTDITFIEIGADGNHIHILMQTTPSYSLSQYIRNIKSNTARMIFKINPEVKKKLWGGEFWSDGYWISTVSKYGTEDVIRDYVKEQGHDKYDLLYKRDDSYQL